MLHGQQRPALIVWTVWVDAAAHVVLVGLLLCKCWGAEWLGQYWSPRRGWGSAGAVVLGVAQHASHLHCAQRRLHIAGHSVLGCCGFPGPEGEVHQGE